MQPDAPPGAGAAAEPAPAATTAVVLRFELARAGLLQTFLPVAQQVKSHVKERARQVLADNTSLIISIVFACEADQAESDQGSLLIENRGG